MFKLSFEPAVHSMTFMHQRQANTRPTNICTYVYTVLYSYMRKITQIIELFAQLLQLITRMSGQMIVSASAKTERPKQIIPGSDTELSILHGMATCVVQKQSVRVLRCVGMCCYDFFTCIYMCVCVCANNVCEIQCENAIELFKRCWHLTTISHSYFIRTCVCIGFVCIFICLCVRMSIWIFCFARLCTFRILQHVLKLLHARGCSSFNGKLL